MSSLRSFARCCRATATLSRWTSPQYCRGPSTSYRSRKVLGWWFRKEGAGPASAQQTVSIQKIQTVFSKHLSHPERTQAWARGRRRQEKGQGWVHCCPVKHRQIWKDAVLCAFYCGCIIPLTGLHIPWPALCTPKKKGWRTAPATKLRERVFYAIFPGLLD